MIEIKEALREYKEIQKERDLPYRKAESLWKSFREIVKKVDRIEHGRSLEEAERLQRQYDKELGIDDGGR